MSAPDGLRAAVDLPGLRQRLRAAREPADAYDRILDWYAQAARVLAAEVAAGRAAPEDRDRVREESPRRPAGLSAG